MRKSLLALAAITVLPLGACTTYGADPLGSVFGSVLGAGNAPYYGQGGQTFESAAAEACAYQAQRYGYATVTNVRAQSSSTLRVSGYVQTNNYGRRSFGCSFREDGRITDFDI